MMPYANIHEYKQVKTARLWQLAFRRPVVLLFLACESLVCSCFSGCFLGQESIPEQIEFSNQNELSIQESQITATKEESSDTTVSRKIKDPVPIAVSAVAPDEAERLNEIALESLIKQIERTEPFYRFYSNNKLQTVCFEGTVRAISTIPNPAENDYDNCLYALFIEIDSLFSNVKEDAQIACEVIVNAPIMKDKIILQDNRFLIGDKIRCTCTEYDEMPQDIQEIQLSDDIQSYEHQQYYPLKIKKISAFQPGGNKSFAKREITILPIQTLPKDEKAVALRKERIQSEIARIEEEITKHGGSFSAWKEDYKPIAAKYKKLCDEGYKGWINDSYFAAGGAESSYKTKEYIEGILPYKKYLEQNNIDLIVVRIPSRWDFAARVLASDDFLENPAWVEHYYECLKNDIEIIDPMPEMWKHRFDFPLFYFYHIPSESHPFEGTSFISAKVLSNVLRRYSFSQSEKEILLENTFITNDSRYFYPEGNDKFDSRGNLIFKQVIRDNKTIGNLEIDSGSPFIFLSNSFFWYPKRSLGASVPGYTAYFLQHIPDWFYQDGGSNPIIRNMISTRNTLHKRNAVIMGAHPSFWRGDFPCIPKYILDNAKKITLDKTIELKVSDFFEETDNSCFLFDAGKNGVIQFSRKMETEIPGQSFNYKLNIPSFDKKSTCMLRINFIENRDINICIISQKDNSIIDSQTLSPGKNNMADLFIPLSNKTSQIAIRFTPLIKSTKEYLLKNIELWYY